MAEHHTDVSELLKTSEEVYDDEETVTSSEDVEVAKATAISNDGLVAVC